jgi:hypothetical protein
MQRMYQIDAVVPVTIKVQKGEIKFQLSNAQNKKMYNATFPRLWKRRQLFLLRTGSSFNNQVCGEINQL